SELGDDKSRAIVLYCRTGNRSGQAKRALEELGYTNVMNAGGYESMRRVQ
ncbi:MAG TPA: rhodanese-like domain-containing protein, partial [Candidatus Eisenbacteria bacterium]|nr:rhodanese-like domain-containing protein [Candidatus Eisenbacteria bacterium]